MIYYHQKPFKIVIDFSESQRALIYYNHGIKTDRSWWDIRKLVQKWKFLKLPVEFESIANIFSPNVHCFVWKKGAFIPQKFSIPLDIRFVEFNQTSFQVNSFDFTLSEKTLPKTIQSVRIREPRLSFVDKVNYKFFVNLNLKTEEPKLK